MLVWRISKAKFAASSFSGEGARLFDGRWNYAGIRMVYTSTSLALAAVEFFVHLDPSVMPDDLVSIKAKLPDNAKVERIDPASLPANWRKVDNNQLRHLGSEWARKGSSLALLVPSAVMDDEWNVLLNPAHPDFAKVEVSPPQPFRYDERMFRR
ncbi:MAG TPA: RES family NAD+ phosphorylase [Bryobacteraceae bacterium]|nr:RES family NAD+ phosphorylase [Bryobacteraceae bacterium]